MQVLFPSSFPSRNLHLILDYLGSYHWVNYSFGSCHHFIII
uniref:Uncharacterized protein n=1 Tax=Arundo donax TaxID=35708 RepID=A0A0A9C664_ARUDO